MDDSANFPTLTNCASNNQPKANSSTNQSMEDHSDSDFGKDIYRDKYKIFDCV